MIRKHALVLLLSAACGCAASTPPPAGAPGSTEAAADSGDGSGQSLAEMREEFLQGCNEGMDAPDYCECSWSQMLDLFSVEELRSEQLDEAKLEQLEERVGPACAGKLPEEAIQASFERKCAGGEERLQPFCTCTWQTMRKKLSIADFVLDRTQQSARFADGLKQATLACGQLLPEDVARQSFLKGCLKSTQLEGFCGCAWKVLRSRASAAEIASGSFDAKGAKPAVMQTCKQHLPSKH